MKEQPCDVAATNYSAGDGNYDERQGTRSEESSLLETNAHGPMIVLKQRLMKAGVKADAMIFVKDIVDEGDDNHSPTNKDSNESRDAAQYLPGRERLVYRNQQSSLSTSTCSSVDTTSSSSSSSLSSPGDEKNQRNDDIGSNDPVVRCSHWSGGKVVEIKTLIWDVTYRLQPQQLQEQHRPDSFPSKTQKCLLVTASPIDDKIDVRRLRDILLKSTLPSITETTEQSRQHHDSQTDQALHSSYFPVQQIDEISLAPLKIAEFVSGFPSGSIPPIGYQKSFEISKLIVDSKITTGYPRAESSGEHPKPVYASVGSGVLGHSLIISLEDLLSVAEFEYPNNVIVESVIAASDNQNEKQDDHNGEESTLNGEVVKDSVKALDGETIRLQRKKERIERQPKPKDRLKEYRRMKSTIERAKLLRTTARKKGRADDMRALVTESIEQGDFPHMFEVQPDEGFSKNCLHLAAWRGDFETVQFLVESAQLLQKEGRFETYDLDIVNMISKGDGNYGKTPIFYALTQCRDDVVRFLVSVGSNLLIVNNKGQTPCSIAVSHMNDETCQLLFAEEVRQLEAGGEFTNYRQSNSDGKLYGDLDPRFTIDDINEGDDIQDGKEKYRQSVSDANSSTIFNGMPTEFSPRSLRATVRWWNRPENATLSEIQKIEGNRSMTDGLPLTFTQPRELKKKKDIDPEISRRGTKIEPYVPRIELPYQLHATDKFELLTLNHVLRNESSSPATLLVNDTETIKDLTDDIHNAIEAVTAGRRHVDDMAYASSAWALDCEWQPGFERGKDHPVATLQLSNSKKAYLIDVQNLCQYAGSDHIENIKDIEPTEIELKLNSALSLLFADSQILLIGFGVFQDLGKLAASFPHLPCFSVYNAVVDLQVVSSVIYSKSTRPLLSSLQKMVALLLGKQLDKTQQCSSWKTRPLSEAQISYALLDAAVLPLLLKTMIDTSQTVARYNGQFFAIHKNNILSCIRYVLLDTNLDNIKQQSSIDTERKFAQEYEWNVPNGSARVLLGRRFARQSWRTKQAPPAFPKLVAFDPNRVTKKEAVHKAKVGETTRPKAKPIQLRTLMANIENLPKPGTELGYTKDSCVNRCVGHAFMNTLPEGTYVGFNRRSGVVETRNAWIIFCNFGSNSTKQYLRGRQMSEFSHGGKILFFNLNPNRKDPRSSEKTLLSHILSKNSGVGSGAIFGGDDRKILLFVRDGTSSKFLYCGECVCNSHKAVENGTSVDLVLELLDFEILTGGSKASSTFTEIVKWREEIYSQSN